MGDLVGVNYNLVNIDFGSVLEGLSAFRRARAEVTFQDIVEATDMSAADLAQMAMENEQLGDILATGLELGARTRLENKRKALGAIVGRAFTQPPDGTVIDECELLLRAIEPLEAPHIDAMVMISRGLRGPRTRRWFKGAVVDSAAMPLRSLSSRLGPTVAPSVVATLEGQGLIEHISDEDVTHTPFGALMLSWLPR